MTPRFKSLWQEPWPYAEYEGVGLRFDGLPNDKDAFIAFLMEYSCHPSAGARIYARIDRAGHDLLTVMSRLDFDAIAIGLKELGVTMSIIAPMPDWTPRFSNGAYPSDFVPPHMRQRKQV